jgi:hypothetical protein
MTWFALALGALALLAMPSLAAAKDRNHDHIPDRWEKKHHLSLKVNQARKDQDGDHLRNRAEFLAGDNPRKADTNGDGVPDGEENAGTIVSFDEETGKLTIDLFGEENISGFVTEETEIKCEGGAGASVSSDGMSGEGEPGDDNGGEEQQAEEDNGGEEEAGDDNGGQGEEEPGDDNGQEEESGDDNGGDNPGPGNGNCTTADLTPGAVVQEAELKIENGKAVFEKVELSGKEAGD